MGDPVNLLAPLGDPRFWQDSVHEGLVKLERRGVRIERHHHTPEDVLAWIDAEFDGTWSTEAHAGGVCIARDADGIIGFAAFDVRGLRFGWLRAWRDRPDVGVFGPFGVVPRVRGTGLGPVLLAFALFSMRERGYAFALIPMVWGDPLIGYYQREANARIVETIDAAQLGGRFRATVLASGNGTNFQSVIDGARNRDAPLPIEIVALVCNRGGAYVLERAAKAEIPSRLVEWDRTSPRAAYDEAVLDAVEATRPDLVLLLGWMHVLSPAFVLRFPETLNVHPAFLPIDAELNEVTMPDGTVVPVFRGSRAVDEMFAMGVAWGGASVHRLGLAVDRGEVLARAPLLREPRESKADFLTRLHALEHRVLATAIHRWAYEHAENMTRPA